MVLFVRSAQHGAASNPIAEESPFYFVPPPVQPDVRNTPMHVE